MKIIYYYELFFYLSNLNVEHSLNTLRYAFRVKEIRKADDNKPSEDDIADHAKKIAVNNERKTGRNYSLDPSIYIYIIIIIICNRIN